MTFSMRRAGPGERLVDRGLELDDAAAAAPAVGGDDQARARVLDAIADGIEGEAAEHHRMHRADPRAGLHGDDRLGNHRHVDHDAVAATDAQLLEAVGEPANLRVQLPVGQAAHVARLALGNDGGLVAARLEVHVQAVP